MESFFGEILLFPFGYAPNCFLPCDGSLMTIQNNQALFSLIGVAYGGDGTTNFNLPDMRGLEPAPGLMYCICVSGIYPTR